MFKSKGSTGAAEPTVIGKGTVVEGTIRVSGRVQIDGQIDGTVIAEGHVSVGPDGSVLGEVAADELAVGGRVEGKITVRGHLHVASNGVARGDMRYGSLQVDRGGVIDGSTVKESANTNDVDSSSNGSPLTTSGRPVSAVS